MYTVGNFYVIAAAAVIGGGLFGFDISSMSAIIGMQQHKPCGWTQRRTNFHRHARVQMLLQRRWLYQRPARMLRSRCRHNGRHYCCDDCWFLGWCFGLWLHLGYDGQTTIDHDWMRALDYWFDHHLRRSKHSDVNRWTHYQWSMRGHSVCPGSCVY